MYVSGFENSPFRGASSLQDLLVVNVSTQASFQPFLKKIFDSNFNLISEIIAASWKPCKLPRMSERWLKEPPCQFVTFKSKVFTSPTYISFVKVQVNEMSW